jgi:Na+-translocating ferredoxin:NAD+ oxidoreductase RnfC subunit
MQSSLPDALQGWGVVGAGGAGFPTDVKLRARAELVIVNGAECEPLLHKDKELIRSHLAEMLSGLRLAMELAGARHAVVGIKEKYEDVIRSVAAAAPNDVSVHALSDTYPAGDEFVLVYDVTGRVIPPGRLPLDVGAVVCNVETLVNLGLRRPVTHKYLTVAGAVAKPRTFRAAVGTPIGDLVAAAGGPTVERPAVLVGGSMMGRLASGPGEPITKTTGGLIVLPEEHALVARYRSPWGVIERVGRSACDQCSFCTELCPRFLLGHPIEPHRAMRALGFVLDADPQIVGTLFCCECNLCSLFSCPESLDPKNVCVHDKAVARAKGLAWAGGSEGVRPHPLFQDRRIPIRRLIQRLGLRDFRNEGPLVEMEIAPERVVLPLKQHAGAPSVPSVRPGERVRQGDLVAARAEGSLGANIHASIAGRVASVDEAVVIEA